MKKLILLASMLGVSLVNGQAFSGSGDNKFQLGANFQENATGLNLCYDLGVGQNMSFGIASTYALDINETINADFIDRFDLKARFNANIGNVISSNPKFDIYPGLNFSLKNFGGHLGARYFFTEGFGMYSEINIPLAKYNTAALTRAEKLHNQITISLGAAFNI